MPNCRAQESDGGVLPHGPAAGRPAIDTDEKLAEAILLFSGTSNGELAMQGFRTLEQRVGKPLADLAEGSEERRISFAQTKAAPVPVITSPEWSGSETGGRRYAPFTVNIERLKPFHTLTGRMHFYLDHDWMSDLGEALPIYRPPLDMHRLFGEPRLGPGPGGSAHAGRGRRRPRRPRRHRARRWARTGPRRARAPAMSARARRRPVVRWVASRS